MNRPKARLAPPDEPAREQAPSDFALLWRLWPFARPDWVPFVIALLTIPFAAGSSLLQPLLIKRAVDSVLVAHSSSALATTVWLYLACIAGDFVARFTQMYLLQLGGQRALSRLRLAAFAKIQKLHLSYLDRTPVGRIVTRVTNDIDALGEVFASGAITAVADVVMLIGIVCFMLSLDWRLSLVAFAALPPLAIAVEFFRRYAREAFRTIRVRIAQLNAYLAEQVQGIAVVQAFGREAECAQEYEEINAAYRDANQRSIRFDALLYSVVESVASITVALVLWYAAVRVGGLPASQSALWVGTVVAFYEYIQRFFVPIRDLSQKYTIVQASLAAAERIFGLLDVSEEDAPPLAAPAGPAPDAGVELALEDVHFGYRPDREVLKGVTLRVRRGETVALVGATGAGKTTVTSLFVRLYDVQRGRVLVRGRDVRDQDVGALRACFGVLGQDVFLFAGTVLSNLAIADDVPDREKAEWALTEVGAWELVSSRDGGLDARVDERGANFSAGERQLLAFARALYAGREILVLDEATARVDSETEARLQKAVLRVLEGRTAIVIAHRLSTIRHADRIVVFHHGQIVEEGSHDELIEQGGVYARLHQLQFAESPAAAS